MKIAVEDLGIQAYGDIWLNFRQGFDPRNGHESAICSLSRGGFVVIDPAAETAQQVRIPQDYLGCGWAVTQAADGAVYQMIYAGKAHLLRWNWQGEFSKHVHSFDSINGVFSIDISADGHVYIPAYTQNVMYIYDLNSGTTQIKDGYSRFGDHIRDVYRAADGWVYVTCTDYRQNCIVALDPRDGSLSRVETTDAAGQINACTGLIKDGDGRVLVTEKCWGRNIYLELIRGTPQPIDARKVRLNQDGKAMAFKDGSYISSISQKTVKWVNAAGVECEFPLQIKPSPLRIFSVAAGGDWIWGGTFIPLTLFSYNVKTGENKFYDNPTDTGGEIYSAVWSNDKLFMASYTGATLTRYEPAAPWNRDASVNANPAPLGRMKQEQPYLHRPKGKTIGPDGSVYFSALGDYGCEDSGICRINPVTEEIRRWLYPRRNFNSICYLNAADQILVSDRRLDEKALHFTRICPETGAEIMSSAAIDDHGDITAWLYDGHDLVYGLHNTRARIVCYSVSRNQIITASPEMTFGHHCHESLIWGPDGRIWGLTRECVFAVDKDLRSPQKIADYDDAGQGNFYRFGIVTGADGNIYFPNGTQLMRLRISS